jgi:NAD-dependent deacetylase
VLHVHGELAWARGTGPSRRRYHIAGDPISLGQTCAEGTQLRPDIVWFGEETQYMDQARAHMASADKVLVVGTSLSIYPAAGLVELARDDAEKLVVALELDAVPSGFTFIREPATVAVPRIVGSWLGA